MVRNKSVIRSQPCRNLFRSPFPRLLRFQRSTLLEHSLQLPAPNRTGGTFHEFPASALQVIFQPSGLPFLHDSSKNARSHKKQPQDKSGPFCGTYTGVIRHNAGNPKQTHSKIGKMEPALSLLGKLLILLFETFRNGTFQLGGSSPFRRRSYFQKRFSHGFRRIVRFDHYGDDPIHRFTGIRAHILLASFTARRAVRRNSCVCTSACFMTGARIIPW